MKTLTLTTVVVGTLLAANGASAESGRYDDRDSHRSQHSQKQYVQKKDRDYQDIRHDDRRYKDRYHHRQKHANGDVIRLDLPVRVRGDGRVHLKRLLVDHYGVNPDQYRLRKVVVTNRGKGGNRGHRYAAARLHVGGQIVDHVTLQRGKNDLQAPRHTNGRWILGLDNARVDNIRVVLEPRGHRVGHHGPSYNKRYDKRYDDKRYTDRTDWVWNEPRRWFKGVVQF